MTRALILLGVALVTWATGREFHALEVPETLYPAPALTEILHLSDFNPLLLGTPGDSEVYVFQGETPGGAMLVLGGTHANEIAGVVTAVLLVESLTVEAGTVYVIPRANTSAATHTQPGEGHRSHFEIATPNGPRRFRHGARFTNGRHQRPSDLEARNLNRVYPGVRDGSLTERVAWAVVELIRRRHIDLAFDLHEAPPDRKLVNMIVVPEISQDLAAEAVFSLQLDGWEFRLESSSHDFRGLSHREWADATNTRPFLTETANPAQGILRGHSGANAAVTGRDQGYLTAAGRGLLSIGYEAEGIPLAVRVARNSAAMATVVELFNVESPERTLRCLWPDAVAIRRDGVGAFVHSAR